MNTRSHLLYLTDILDAIARIETILKNTTLESFEADWQKQWMVERGVEIVSEASRHLSDELKSAHAQIPWRKVAGIGNILRHDYGRVSAPIMWKLAIHDLPIRAAVCRREWARAQAAEPE